MTRRKDPVSHEIAGATFRRDEFTCLAPRLDPECGPCSGHLTVEHVREHAATGAPRAPSKTTRWLATLCQGHTEPGMKAGRVWNLSHKAELRVYLEERAAA
jgi:hypothetical protein